MSARSSARFVVPALLVFVLAACDTTTSGPSAGLRTVHEAPPADAVDLRFEPLTWSAGDQIVAASGQARLTSTATPDGRHSLAVDAPAERIQRVVGLLDGVAQAETASDGGGVGSTAAGPTSIHRDIVCRGSQCVEVIEYDYDLTSTDGNGTTLWSPPSGPETLIDRIRVELSQVAAAPAVVSLSSALRFQEAQ